MCAYALPIWLYGMERDRLTFIILFDAYFMCFSTFFIPHADCYVEGRGSSIGRVCCFSQVRPEQLWSLLSGCEIIM
jgi:hypothetical protein